MDTLGGPEDDRDSVPSFRISLFCVCPILDEDVIARKVFQHLVFVDVEVSFILTSLLVMFDDVSCDVYDDNTYKITFFQ